MEKIILKEPFTVWILPELKRAFKTYAFTKHKSASAIGREAEKMFREYLQKNGVDVNGFKKNPDG